MQMYKVAFTSRRGALVESGTFLVCASSAEHAENLVSAHASLPPSTSSFDTSRIKPSIYELRRTEFRENVALGSSSHDEGGAVHEVRVSAQVFAYSDETAVRRLATTLKEQTGPSRVSLPRFVNELDVDVQRQDTRPRASRVEEQSIYRETRFFPGGAARPR